MLIYSFPKNISHLTTNMEAPMIFLAEAAPQAEGPGQFNVPWWHCSGETWGYYEDKMLLGGFKHLDYVPFSWK